MNNITKKIINYLKEQKISYEAITHPPVKTCEEQAEKAKIKKKQIAKSILFSSNQEYVLIVVPGNRTAPRRIAEKIVNRRLKLASNEEIKKIANCNAGEVYPFPVFMNKKPIPIVDEGLLKSRHIYFSPGSNEITIKIKVDDFKKILGEVIIMESENKQNKKNSNDQKTTLGITAKKHENFSEWYSQAIQKSELADYSSVSGCIVYRPYSYEIWEKIRDFFDEKIKKSGVKNSYFPLLIPESLLSRESDHVEGFAPEVAWVTQGGNTKLGERLAVRPTSETIMYDSYSKWIRSYNDLPLRLNQWNNVVRWEFKHATPFLRGREFLWQEGHTVFATKEEAEKEVLEILGYYAEIYEKLLAVPVVKGKKTEMEKFAGAVYSTSCETFLPVGKAIQGCTSHFLGQNFSKAFDISFLDKSGKKQYGWQNSWGFTTRSIGVMVIMHGDDKGLVLPPRVAPLQIVIIPILFEKSKSKVLEKAREIKSQLGKFSVLVDDRNYSPGRKYNEWELKGVPLRIEIGPKDIEKNQAVIVRRDTGEKEAILWARLNSRVEELLEDIQNNLFNRAKKMIDSSFARVKTWQEFVKAASSKKWIRAMHCGDPECEKEIKEKTSGVKTNNVPFDQPKRLGECVLCKRKAKYEALFSKSY